MDAENTFHLALSDGRQFGPATMEQILQWAREGRVPKDALLRATDGSEPQSVLARPELRMVLEAPPTVSTGVSASASSGRGPALIPYRNGPALAGYYVAVVSLIPCLALVTGPIAATLGIAGWIKVRKNPDVRGTAHAIVAIVLGLLTFGANVALIVLFRYR